MRFSIIIVLLCPITDLASVAESEAQNWYYLVLHEKKQANRYPFYRGAVLPRELKISDHMTFNSYHDWISSYRSLQSMNNIENSMPPPDPHHGFQYIDGPDHQKVLVPIFMVPATKLALEKERTRIDMKVDDAVPGDLCEREALNLHSEVKALQAAFGISYRDAAHRLYMASVERMEIETQTKNEFADLKGIIDDIQKEIYPRIDMIDRESTEEH